KYIASSMIKYAAANSIVNSADRIVCCSSVGLNPTLAGTPLSGATALVGLLSLDEIVFAEVRDWRERFWKERRREAS
ncbi:MAG: hypothetical protein ACRYGG_06215, partial [Janthinobacterium lividum]